MLVQLEIQLIRFGREYEPGEAVELPDDEARRFIERGMAVPVAPAIEMAAIEHKRDRHGRIKTARTPA